MKKYLIVKCEELEDQYECDADRTPVAMTDDFKEWYKKNTPQYSFEVWEYSEENEERDEFKLVKEYTESLESGMAFYYWEENESGEEPPHILNKWEGRTRKEPIPDEVLNYGGVKYYDVHRPLNWERAKKEVKEEGSIGFFSSSDASGRYYVYGEYKENNYYGH